MLNKSIALGVEGFERRWCRRIISRLNEET